jgi:hypothetical protein
VNNDVALLAAAVESLGLAPRGNRWCHLSLCILDAVFSINANYQTTSRTTRGYATLAGLEPVLAPAAEVATGLHLATEQRLSDFVATECEQDPDAFATRLDNRQLTSTRSGIRKAEAVQRYGRILVDHGVETLADVGTLLSDPDQTKTVEKVLSRVPGHGSGVRVSYLWMLAGDDSHVKADRMVIRWVSRALDRTVTVKEAGHLVVETAAVLGVTPWVLDHAVWQAERTRA